MATKPTGKPRGKAFQISHKSYNDIELSKPRKSSVKVTRLTYTHNGDSPRAVNNPAPKRSDPNDPNDPNDHMDNKKAAVLIDD